MPSKKKNSGLIAASWVLFVVILLIIFFVKKDRILTNLKKTDFFGRVFGSTPEFIKNHKIDDSNAAAEETEATDLEIDVLPPHILHKTEQDESETAQTDAGNPVYADGEMPAFSSNSEFSGAEHSTRAENSISADTALPSEYPALMPPHNDGSAVQAPHTESGGGAQAVPLDTGQNHSASSAQAGMPLPKPSLPLRDVSLCFVVIDSDGSVSRKIVTRRLSKSASPMTDALNALLAGPLPEEQSKNCMTLIPSGTKLLGATVKDGVATLNFSESFEFNSVGVEGYIAQLMQIVYTATEFPTVKSVQFLIEGRRKDYLGSEGQWIGSPLTRSGF